MSEFLYGTLLQWKLNLRSKEILVHFYIVPLIFYRFIGGIFTYVNPEAYKTIIPAMTVFGVTMGGVLGSPYSLVEFYGSENKKAYQVGHIPLWTMAAGNFISGLLHLFIMSMIILATGPVFFDALVPQNLASYILSLILLIAASLSIGMVFGLFFKSTAKMGMMTQIVFLPSIMLSGVMFSVSLLPDILQKIGFIFPATLGFRAMCEDNLTLTDLLPLLIIVFFAILISIWKIKKIQIE